MSQVKKHIRLIASLAFAALFALSCARGSGQTQFSKNMEADSGKPAPTYEEWVSLIGQSNADQLFAGIGQDSLNLLAYGIGTSNITNLINTIGNGASPKLIALIGNDFTAGTGPGGRTGLGAIITVYLLKAVDAQMQVNISANLPLGNAVPTDQDTVVNLANIIITLSQTEIQQKIVDMFGAAGGTGFDLSRGMSAATTSTVADQKLYVDRMARVVAHVSSGASSCAAKLCPLLTSLSATEVQQRLSPMIKWNSVAGMTHANKLIETIETTASIANLVYLIQNVTLTNITAKMLPIIDNVTDCTKMGYVINGVTVLDTLVGMINGVIKPIGLGKLINMIEDGTTWASQVSPAETWGTGPLGQASKGAPFSTTVTAATITGNVPVATMTTITVSGGGLNYLPGVTLNFAACTVQPVIHLNIQGGIIQAAGHNIISGGTCSAGAAQPATVVTAGTTTALARLVAVINGITDSGDADALPDYYKLLAVVDGVDSLSIPPDSLTKMARLIQDGSTPNDIFDLLNQMSGLMGAGCTVATGSDTVSIVGGGGTLAAATSYNVSGGVAYIGVTSLGSGYTSQPTITVPGCGGVTFRATIVSGEIRQIVANSPVNNLSQVIELLSLANLPRLQQVLDGQRAYDNNGNQAPAATAGTYLNKMSILMANLDQTLEGPLKVGDLLNGVTNPDKIIDLIYGVTVTANLSTVINGIFAASTGIGCSDGSAGTYSGVPGVGNTTAVDTGTCENSGNGFFYGERDRAVTTLVYLVENVASTAKLISMIDNITPANVVALVNHTSTYSQHDDLTTHVHPRGAVGLDHQAAGKRLAKIVDNTTTITQLNFVANNVSSIIKMSKLVSFMDIGASATTGTGKLAILINAVTGANAYLATTVPGRGNPTGNATGMGKMVNVIDFVAGATPSAAMFQLKNLMNSVSDINKLADLINQTVSSSNVVGLLNGVIDPRYGTSTTDLVALLNALPRGEISKLVSLVGEIGNAYETTTATFAGPDHELIAQLMAGYSNYTTVPATVTATVATDNITWTAHGLTVDRIVTFSNIGGGLPAPLVSGMAYYVVNVVDANNFRVSATRGGTQVDITSTGTGTHTGSAGGVSATSGVGVADMNALIGLLGMTGGSGYTASFNTAAGDLNLGGGTGAVAQSIVSPNLNTLTKLQLDQSTPVIAAVSGGVFPTVPTAVTIGGTCPGATASVVGARIDGGATFKVTGIYLTDGGTGGCTAPTFTFTPAPTTAPQVVYATGGIIGFNITNGGANYTDSFAVSSIILTGGGGSNATATALVAGPLNTTPGTGLTNFSGGQGYVNNQVCPVIGAGGSGATCTVSGTGAMTGCSAITGGTGYIDGQIVTIGGAARAKATTVAAGSLTVITPTNSGCGYTPGTIPVQVLTGANECATPGTYVGNVNAGGQLASVTTTLAATGCPANPTIIVGGGFGGAAYAAHSDGGTAQVGAVVGGQVVALSLSTPSDYLAQLLVNTEKAPLYNAVTYAGATPNISAREAMVRLLRNGTQSTDAGWATGYFYFPGAGPVYIAANVLSTLTGTTSTQSIIDLLNSDSTGLEQFPILMGCLDHIQYGTVVAESFYTGCTTHTPNLW